MNVTAHTESRGNAMKKLARKAALTLAATAATVGLVAVSAPPAQALDSGWGCGGACRTR